MALDEYDSEGHAIGAMSKIFCGELMYEAVFKCMQAMGVNATDKRHPLEKCLREAIIFPLYDAGNVGMQRRKIWGVMPDPSFDPRAMMDNSVMEFTKDMDGTGLSRTLNRISKQVSSMFMSRGALRSAPGGDGGNLRLNCRTRRELVSCAASRSGIDGFVRKRPAVGACVARVGARSRRLRYC